MKCRIYADAIDDNRYGVYYHMKGHWRNTSKHEVWVKMFDVDADFLCEMIPGELDDKTHVDVMEMKPGQHKDVSLKIKIKRPKKAKK